MTKGLEALERIKKSHHIAIAVMGCERDIETENAIDIIEKQLKALEIIKNRRIDMWHLMMMLEQDYHMYVAFCESEGYDNEYIATKEEFKLLKEVLDE